MPRRRQDQAVSQRANEILDEQARRRREAALRGAQTRRQRREQREAEARAQAEGERPTQGNVARSRRPRVHGEMMTVAMRGPIADKMREMAELHGMSLAKLLGDMVLVYEARVTAGHRPGMALEEWKTE